MVTVVKVVKKMTVNSLIVNFLATNNLSIWTSHYWAVWLLKTSNILYFTEMKTPSLYLLATIRLPSDKTISPLSTKVFKIQVTFVGALSASSITKICPNFTAFT